MRLSPNNFAGGPGAQGKAIKFWVVLGVGPGPTQNCK